MLNYATRIGAGRTADTRLRAYGVGKKSSVVALGGRGGTVNDGANSLEGVAKLRACESRRGTESFDAQGRQKGQISGGIFEETSTEGEIIPVSWQGNIKKRWRCGRPWSFKHGGGKTLRRSFLRQLALTVANEATQRRKGELSILDAFNA